MAESNDGRRYDRWSSRVRIIEGGTTRYEAESKDGLRRDRPNENLDFEQLLGFDSLMKEVLGVKSES